MKIAVVGSRNIFLSNAQLSPYLVSAKEIVSGGAKGVDSCAARYAKENHIKLTEFLPAYDLYGRYAPIIRNKQIVDYADMVIIFWDGRSKGSLSVIKYAEKTQTPYQVIEILKS